MTPSPVKIKGGMTLAMLFASILIGSAAAHAVTIHEYLTPTPDSSPTDLAVDAEGNIWFTEINAGKIGKLIPSKAKPGTSEGFIEYDLPNPNSQPQYIMVARDGSVWFTELRGNKIGRLDPKTGKIREFPVPTPESEPHKMLEARDGSIWFLEFETNKVAHLNPQSGEIKEYKVNEGHPHDLVLDGDQIWYTQGGKFWAQVFANKIGRLDIKSGKIEEITVPPEKSVPHGMDQGEDGTIWFTQLFAGKISRLDRSKNPARVVDYLVPGKRKGPHDLTVDNKRGLIWFVENRADGIGRLDLAKAKPGTDQGMQEFKIPTRGAHPSAIALDQQGNVWFTEMGMFFRGKYMNKIGRLIP